LIIDCKLAAKGQSSALDVLAAFREHCCGAADARLNRRAISAMISACLMTTGSDWGGR